MESGSQANASRQPAGQAAGDAPEAAAARQLRVWRGDQAGGALTDYAVGAGEGEVVLDVLHRLQATQANDLAIRWNCKAGMCGSCSAEVNGRPELLCMTRLSSLPEGPIKVGQVGGDRAHRSQYPEANPAPGRPVRLGSARHVQQAGGDPTADRHVGQQRVQRVV